MHTQGVASYRYMPLSVLASKLDRLGTKLDRLGGWVCVASTTSTTRALRHWLSLSLSWSNGDASMRQAGAYGVYNLTFLRKNRDTLAHDMATGEQG